jgi:hypothetical protein
MVKFPNLVLPSMLTETYLLRAQSRHHYSDDSHTLVNILQDFSKPTFDFLKSI